MYYRKQNQKQLTIDIADIFLERFSLTSACFSGAQGFTLVFFFGRARAVFVSMVFVFVFFVLPLYSALLVSLDVSSLDCSFGSL